MIKWKLINAFLLNNITYYSYFFTNIHKQCKLHWGDCLQQQYDNDNVVSIFTSKAWNQRNTVREFWLSTKHQCCKHRVHLFLSHCCPVLCQPGTWAICGSNSLISDAVAGTGLFGHNGLSFHIVWPAWVPFVYFLSLQPDISQEQALNQDVLAWLLFQLSSSLGRSIW